MEKKPGVIYEIEFDGDGNLVRVESREVEEIESYSFTISRMRKWVIFFLLLGIGLFVGTYLFRIYLSREMKLGLIIGSILLFLISFMMFLHVVSVQGKWISSEEFMNDWIIDRNKQKGYKYQDRPGCYVIMTFDHSLKNQDDLLHYQNVYVGQSLNVYHRIFNHFSARGNGKVYSDIRNGMYAYVRIVPCKAKQLNEKEKELIELYHATNSYNQTSGGATHR